MSRILQARDLSSYPKNRINDETRKVLEMALVRNTRSNDSSLYTNITVYQCVGMKPTALPCTTEYTQTSQIKVGE
jgi:hypothetical protein